jgi:hypothetical protein
MLLKMNQMSHVQKWLEGYFTASTFLVVGTSTHGEDSSENVEIRRFPAAHKTRDPTSVMTLKSFVFASDWTMSAGSSGSFPRLNFARHE